MTLSRTCPHSEWRVACPFFMPTGRLENGAWPHPARLPLGRGWTGHCTAPGHDGEIPDSATIEQFCNMGYSAGCAKLPSDRTWDAVRFSPIGVRAAHSMRPSKICLRYVCERSHLPVENGILEFDMGTARCTQPHPDARVQKMAECFLASYIEQWKLRGAGVFTNVPALDCPTPEREP